MESYVDRVNSAVAYIKSHTDIKPRFGIILGTGLGNLANEIDVKNTIHYSDIPGFPVSTVESHRGELIFGNLSGKPIVAMAGRLHYYEGFDMKELTFPTRVLKLLGIEALIISSASGAVNEDILMGDIVIINDHINVMPDNPLRGENHAEWGPRFPDMLKTYDPDLIKKAVRIARNNNIRVHTGVYVSVPGPNLETPAEYKFFHIIGGDIVGMSTVPEVLIAKHMKLKVLGLSVCTDRGYPPEVIQEVSLEDVIEIANQTEPKLTLIIKELLAEL